MVLTIVRKELRETRLFAALAVGIYLIYVSRLTGKWGRAITSMFQWFPGLNVEAADIPFVEDNFVTMLFFIGVALAIALGFRQSAWEPSQGTALYLLHLPLPRHAIIMTKLSTGIGILLVCTLLPILIYATWATVPGTHPGPFEWSMTWSAFHVWLSLPLAYFGRIRQRHPPGTLVRLTAVAACVSGDPRHLPEHFVALVAARFPATHPGGGDSRQRYSLGSRNTRFLTARRLRTRQSAFSCGPMLHVSLYFKRLAAGIAGPTCWATQSTSRSRSSSTIAPIKAVSRFGSHMAVNVLSRPKSRTKTPFTARRLARRPSA